MGKRQPTSESFPYIHPGLRHLATPIRSLNLDPLNAIVHTQESINKIAASLSEFGQDQPLVVQYEGRIIRKGNGRWRAAIFLGWTHIAALIVNEETAASICRSLADNRVRDFASWDLGILGQVMRSIQRDNDLPYFTGWTEKEVQSISSIPRDEDKPIPMGAPVRLTVEQRAVFDDALRRVRAQADQPDMSEGRCLELICGDYLAGR